MLNANTPHGGTQAIACANASRYTCLSGNDRHRGVTGGCRPVGTHTREAGVLAAVLLLAGDLVEEHGAWRSLTNILAVLGRGVEFARGVAQAGSLGRGLQGKLG